jgi:hypothetical protein
LPRHRVARSFAASALLLALAAPGPAAGRDKTDLVVLVNGNGINGEIMSLSRGKLDYKTDDAGRLSIKWLKVARVTSTFVYEVETTAGVKRYSALYPPDGDERGERLLFKTHNSGRCWDTDAFVEDFVYISAAGARYLAERRVRLVGVDYLSVGGFRADGVETHRALLEAGIWIIEGLDLRRVRPGGVQLLCLPLKILGGDGAPARALVRRSGRSGGGRR